MFETLTIDVTNVKKILDCCPYYDDIINSDIVYEDDFSVDLIDWYRDLIFSCDGDNNDEYRKGIRKIINFNLDDYKIVNKILDFTDKYEINEILNITTEKWL